MRKFILLNFVIIFFLKTVFTQDCFTENDNLFCKLGSKSPYRFVANYNTTPIDYPDCKPIKIWMVIRHGTRYPGKENIKLFNENLPELKQKIIDNHKLRNSELSEKVVKKFNEWNLNINKDKAKILTEEGEDEMIDLAERMQSRFPSILKENYSNKTYRFKYTDTQRTEISAKSFALGLFGQYNSQDVYYPKPEEKDFILRFYKNCERWISEVKKNPATYKERNLFINSSIFENLLKDVSKTVGFNVTYDNVAAMHLMCVFETAWYRSKKSPWCDVFTLENIKILEYKDDLQYFAVHGYGNSINYLQSCPALIDMFKFMESTDETLATLYFTHSGTIVKILSILGIAKDEVPLTHDSFTEHKDSRKWRVSYIDTFGSNIAFVLYDCKPQGKSIVILHQERQVNIDGCPTDKPCPISTMKKLFADNDEECKFKSMCARNPKK